MGVEKTNKGTMRKKILVVDNNSGILRLLSETLGDDMGHRIICAESSAGGVNIIEKWPESEGPLDILFVEKNCPGENSGFKVMEAMREKFPEVKIVLMDDGVMNGIRGMDVLRKPFTRQEIKAVFEKLYGPIKIPETA